MLSTILPTPLLLTLVLLASCSAPPKPPTADESRRRPVNSAMVVELQVCQNDLLASRLLAAHSGRLAQASAATLASVFAHQQALIDLQRRDQPQQVNSVYTLHFEHGSARVDLALDSASVLIADAKSAPLVLLRGRTDAGIDTPAEARMARQRAAAVKDYLVAAGVDASRIRATYQPAGDHVAANASAAGRALNRRVEIEVYRAVPAARELARRGSATAGQDDRG